MGHRKKILFSDLDGTLLNDRKEIDEDTLRLLRRLREEGHLFSICTGRPLASAKEIASRFGLVGEGCYIIAYNGGAIYDPFHDTTIFYATIPKDYVFRMFQAAQDYGLYIHTYDSSTDTILVQKDTKELQRYRSHTRLPWRSDFRLEEKGDPPKAMLISLTNHDLLNRFYADNICWTKEAMNGFFSCAEYLEYAPKGVSKGDAVRRLCGYLGMPLEHSIGIGDERNDLPMMEVVGLSASPANALTDVLNSADVVCKNTNNGGAVGELIQHFVLSE